MSLLRKMKCVGINGNVNLESEEKIMNLLRSGLIVFVMCFLASSAQARLYSGAGTVGDPFIIDTAAKINDIGNNEADWDKHFKLTKDISLAGYPGTTSNIIGYFLSLNDYCPFTGVFDGDGHTISNFTYICPDTGAKYIGIFGYVEGATIKNLGLIDPNVDTGTLRSTSYPQGGSSVGALVGAIVGSITNCYVHGGSVTGEYFVGGLVGLNYGVFNSYSTGNVTGTAEFVGGLVGYNNSGVGGVSKCYSTGSVAG